jgi:hypothetical protein
MQGEGASPRSHFTQRHPGWRPPQQSHTMFHMLRQSGTGSPAVMIRLLESLVEVDAVEHNPDCRRRYTEVVKSYS